jgi:hypothetical protein
MKKSVVKYLIALVLLVIFSGGQSVSIFPGYLNDSRWLTWQKQESENDATRSENSNGTETKEFVAELTSYNLSLVLSKQLIKQYRDYEFSYKRTYFLAVPTPPPDFA